MGSKFRVVRCRFTASRAAPRARRAPPPLERSELSSRTEWSALGVLISAAQSTRGLSYDHIASARVDVSEFGSDCATPHHTARDWVITVAESSRDEPECATRRWRLSETTAIRLNHGAFAVVCAFTACSLLGARRRDCALQITRARARVVTAALPAVLCDCAMSIRAHICSH